MPDVHDFQHKQRRSSFFSSHQAYQDYMKYASQCYDQIDVYFYMQENLIGINQPRFWLAMLKILKLKCQFKLIIKKLSLIKKNSLLKQHSDFLKILLFQETLANQLQMQIRKKNCNKRRSIKQFQLFSIGKIQKKKRKIGGIEVYVDQDCRDNYRLEDYSQFYMQNMKDQVQSKRYEYERKQHSKPLSFLGHNQNNIKKWSLQLIEMKKRASTLNQNCNNERKSAFLNTNNNNSNRFSVSRRSNLINKNNPQTMNFQTPQKNFEDQLNSSMTTPKLKNKSQRLNFDDLNKSYKKTYKKQFPSEFLLPEKENSQQDLLDDAYLEEDSIMDAFNFKQTIRAGQGQALMDNYVDNFQHLNNFGKNNIQINSIYNNERQQFNDFSQKNQPQMSFMFDRQLEELIFASQLESLKKVSNQSEILFDSQNLKKQHFSNKKNYFQCQEQNQGELSNNLCIKSTQTLESIDSNQQNIFTNKKDRQFRSQYIFDKFRSQNNNLFINKDRKVFQQLRQQDLMTNSNIQLSNISSSDLLKINQKNQILSVQGNNCIRQIIHQIDNFFNIQSINYKFVEKQVQENARSQNIVLQTLRKKKINTILTSQHYQYQNQYEINSEKRNMVRHLSYISEEKSYNSQRKFESKQRYSSSRLSSSKEKKNSQQQKKW